MTQEDFVGLAQLRTTPEVLRGILTSVDEETAARRPAEGRWSLLEILGHLVQVEEAGFRQRLERMVREEDPELENYDPDAHAAAGEYAKGSIPELLAALERQREDNLRMLEQVPAAAMERGGRHARIGPITVRQLLHEWALHDLGHVRQAAEVVRALLYYPEIGPWQKEYRIAP